MESFDRSTSREYADLEKDLDGQIDKLQNSQTSVADLYEQRFQSLLKQVSYTCTVHDWDMWQVPLVLHILGEITKCLGLNHSVLLIKVKLLLSIYGQYGENGR